MGNRYRQESMGLDVLKPNDSTLWKRALKSKSRRTANERKLVFGRQPSPGILALILNYLRDRMNEKHHHR